MYRHARSQANGHAHSQVCGHDGPELGCDHRHDAAQQRESVCLMYGARRLQATSPTFDGAFDRTFDGGSRRSIRWEHPIDYSMKALNGTFNRTSIEHSIERSMGRSIEPAAHRRRRVPTATAGRPTRHRTSNRSTRAGRAPALFFSWAHRSTPTANDRGSGAHCGGQRNDASASRLL